MGRLCGETVSVLLDVSCTVIISISSSCVWDGGAIEPWHFHSFCLPSATQTCSTLSVSAFFPPPLVSPPKFTSLEELCVEGAGLWNKMKQFGHVHLLDSWRAAGSLAWALTYCWLTKANKWLLLLGALCKAAISSCTATVPSSCMNTTFLLQFSPLSLPSALNYCALSSFTKLRRAENVPAGCFHGF